MSVAVMENPFGFNATGNSDKLRYNSRYLRAIGLLAAVSIVFAETTDACGNKIDSPNRAEVRKGQSDGRSHAAARNARNGNPPTSNPNPFGRPRRRNSIVLPGAIGSLLEQYESTSPQESQEPQEPLHDDLATTTELLPEPEPQAAPVPVSVG